MADNKHKIRMITLGRVRKEAVEEATKALAHWGCYVPEEGIPIDVVVVSSSNGFFANTGQGEKLIWEENPWIFAENVVNALTARMVEAHQNKHEGGEVRCRS